MATYDELLSASENADLFKKVRVAVIVAAEVVRTELGTVPNHTNRLIWAKAVFTNPLAEVQRMMMAVLAKNRTFTLNQIITASDATVQTAVNAAVDMFATGA